VEQAQGGRAARVGKFALRLVLALVLLAVLLPALAIFSFTPWVEIPATLLVLVAAFALAWRFSWRRERDLGTTLRRTSPSRRTLVVVLALGGPAFCVVADYWLASRYPRYADASWLAGPGWDVASAAPFVLLAILLLVTGLSRLAAVLAALALGAIFVFAFWSFATTDSSTASLALLAPWFYGFPLVGLVFAVDAGARSLLRSRQSHDA
jgi:hypothetical protein